MAFELEELHQARLWLRLQMARAGDLVSHPLCVYCEREGRVTADTVVDHRIPRRGG